MNEVASYDYCAACPNDTGGGYILQASLPNTRATQRCFVRLTLVPVILARVKSFSNEEGWGVLEAPEAPGDIFVHFSEINLDGYKVLEEGQTVEIELEGPLDFDQGGCRWIAHDVRPIS